jgi:hypothetical protein
MQAKNTTSRQTVAAPGMFVQCTYAAAQADARLQRSSPAWHRPTAACPWPPARSDNTAVQELICRLVARAGDTGAVCRPALDLSTQQPYEASLPAQECDAIHAPYTCSKARLAGRSSSKYKHDSDGGDGLSSSWN